MRGAGESLSGESMVRQSSEYWDDVWRSQVMLKLW